MVGGETALLPVTGTGSYVGYPHPMRRRCEIECPTDVGACPRSLRVFQPLVSGAQQSVFLVFLAEGFLQVLYFSQPVWVTQGFSVFESVFPAFLVAVRITISIRFKPVGGLNDVSQCRILTHDSVSFFRTERFFR